MLRLSLRQSKSREDDYVKNPISNAQPLNALVQTPDGWVVMEEIKVGDKIVTPDGHCANVIGVHPKGVQDIYRIYFADGRWTDCGELQLWRIYNPLWTTGFKWRFISLQEIIAYRRLHNNADGVPSIQFIEPEIKEDSDLPLDPYLLGVLLGDGYLRGHAIDLATSDQFIIDEIRKYLPDDMEIVHRARYNHHLVKKTRNKGVGGLKPNFVKSALTNLGLHVCYSYNKFIPRKYMEASPNQKLKLLQGLMDTDGGIAGNMNSKRSLSPFFATTSIEMMTQVRDIVRSLGGMGKILNTQTHYSWNGEKKAGRPSYRMTIVVKDPRVLFRLPRKIDRFCNYFGENKKARLRITDVRHIGRAETQCIEIDDVNGFYVTNDYISIYHGRSENKEGT